MSEADSLAPFFTRFALAARVFQSGRLCGVSSDHKTETAGHLHILRQGQLNVTRPGAPLMRIIEPSVLFYPRPCLHRFQADAKVGAEIVCAYVEFGAGMLNPLVAALPEALIVSLASSAELAPTAEMLFAEAFSARPARQSALDRLTEYFLILLLRVALNSRLIRGGVLSGLSDARLAAALGAIHQRPEHPWSLAELAQLAGMSRARFAVNFREATGVTPFDYLTDWRIGVAQTLLRQGQALKIVAPSVGYQSSPALTRAFIQKLGQSPTSWLATINEQKR